MAATASDSTPNGTKLEEAVKGEPENEVVTASGTAGDGVGDLTVSSPQPGEEEVSGAPANSTKKVGHGATPAADTVTNETSDQKKIAVDHTTEEVLKESPAMESEIKNALDNKETNVNKEIKMDQSEGPEVKDPMDVDSEKNVEQNDIVEEEEKIESMDIDGKRQEEKVDPNLELKAGVVVNPKKKYGRPRKPRNSEVPEGKKEELKTPLSDTKERARQKKEAATPQSERDRPARERKSIERFVASVEKGKRELVIKQGPGTPLMDIPNVAFKLSKRPRGDEILHMLHSLLYHQRAKVNAVKYNIFRFSGYVWTENEEKERIRVKEKLERFTKEGLGQLIDVLDLQFNKTGKKEELVAKVLEFLESPHKTTEVSLEEREQRLKEDKRKSRSSARGRGPGRKRHKLEESGSTKKQGRRKRSESDEDTEGEYANSEDESLEEEEEVERKRLTFVDDDDDDDDDDRDEDYEAKQKPPKRPTKHSKEEDQKVEKEKVSNDEESDGNKAPVDRLGAKSAPNTSLKSPSASSPDITRSSSRPAEKVYTKGSRKKTKELKEKEKKEVAVPKRGGKQKGTSKEQVVEKSTSRGRKGRVKEPPAKKKKSTEIPPDELLQNEIRDLLKDLSPADFSKVTFMDIVIQLEEKFNIDLSVNKAHVKLLIRQEVSRLATEGQDDDDDQEGTEGEGEGGAAEVEIEAEPELEPEPEAEVEPEAEPVGAAEGVADGVTKLEGKLKMPETDEAAAAVKETGGGGAVDPGDAPKNSENEDVKSERAPEAEVRSNAEELKETKVEDDQLQTTEGADKRAGCETTGK